MREQFRQIELGRGQTLRREELWSEGNFNLSVGLSIAMGKNMDTRRRDIHHPNLLDARCSVHVGLLLQINRKARIRDFDQQQNVRGCGPIPPITPRPKPQKIRLWPIVIAIQSPLDTNGRFFTSRHFVRPTIQVVNEIVVYRTRGVHQSQRSLNQFHFLASDAIKSTAIDHRVELNASQLGDTRAHDFSLAIAIPWNELSSSIPNVSIAKPGWVIHVSQTVHVRDILKALRED